ncbi:pyridoxamine 5'-phosphate oxidase family protein [Lactobacillus sp. LC28-10]|uniref:Pyridoxamine 5'-phosphate oxidase family protein n=1 Tax=Secundilactobacillus angelensis TaxID=2722706 RepID=A0ABX1KZY4_9LACO|nr:pyridoxamine 5'-phosphate oxidase family protein [Secundilactobacillus angelensis]MCH5463033.1 pyridoxamine 5'-phosphate oxidase family protein [Secundilactobacillus angelensis]NLR19499.1 pyridoxamine 5'-phosphate oxidase family protein [Secundilactobacillus angelensis]
MRRTDREITDVAAKLDIIEDAHIINLGVLDFPAPYVVPSNYGYEFTDNQLHLYIHGAAKGKRRGLIAANPAVSFSIIADSSLDTPAEGAPLSHYSYFYRSVLGTGNATLVSDLPEKEHALRLLLKHENGHDVPGEISQQDLAHVGVIRIDVDQFTGKQHSAK